MGELGGGYEGRKWKDKYTIIFPNLFTLGNLFAGFFSIINSLNGDYLFASYMILVATIFDLVDGRIARMVKGVTVFGKELDSLSDLVSFGVAPAILAYLSVLHTFGRIGWLVAFLFVATGALRLARFNATSSIQDPSYFMGLPVPIAASWVVSGYLFFREIGLTDVRTYIFIAMMITVSFFFFFVVKYKSYKKPGKAVKKEFFTNMVKFVVILIAVAIKPSLMLFVVISFYVFWGFFIFPFNLKKKKEVNE